MPNSHYSLQLPHPTQQVQILKKVCQTAVTNLLSAAGCRLDMQHSPLKTYHRTFSRAEKPSEDITRHLFLMNMKGLICKIVRLYFFSCEKVWIRHRVFGTVYSKAWSTTHRIRSLSTRRPSNERLICVHLFPDLHTGENIYWESYRGG